MSYRLFVFPSSDYWLGLWCWCAAGASLALVATLVCDCHFNLEEEKRGLPLT